MAPTKQTCGTFQVENRTVKSKVCHCDCKTLTGVKFTSNVASTCLSMWWKFHVDMSFLLATTWPQMSCMSTRKQFNHQWTRKYLKSSHFRYKILTAVKFTSNIAKTCQSMCLCLAHAIIHVSQSVTRFFFYHTCIMSGTNCTISTALVWWLTCL